MIFADVFTYWLFLSGVCFSMVFGGGIEWIHRREIRVFSEIPVPVWKRVHQFIWLLGTALLLVCALLT